MTCRWLCSLQQMCFCTPDAPYPPPTSIFVPLNTYPTNCLPACLPGCRAVTPDFGGLLKRELFLEGAFRNAHARLRTHAESGGWGEEEALVCLGRELISVRCVTTNHARE
jgi:hypothetical protein